MAMALITINRIVVVQEHPDDVVARPPRRRGVRRVAAATAVLAVAGVGATAALASPQPLSQTQVTMIPLSVPHKVAGTTIGANKTFSFVVSGGSTTVPANATTVQLAVTAKGASGGSLNFYPTGNPTGASGQTLHYLFGNALVSTTIQEKIGESSKLTVSNASAGSATITATVNGYSTQVTNEDVNGVGGSAGDVLTNTGSGAAWTTPNFLPGPSNAGTSGDILTKTPTGSVWTTPNFAAAATNTTVIHPTGDYFANGAALRAALASGAKPIVEIEGGNYYLGSAPLEFADREILIGAGPDATFVTSSGNINLNGGEISGVQLNFADAGHLVADAGISYLRNIEIDTTAHAANTTAIGLEVSSTADVSLLDSTILVLTYSGTSPAISVLVNTNSVAFIRNSNITTDAEALGAPVYAINTFGFATVDTSLIQAFGGGSSSSAVVITHLSSNNSATIDASKVESGDVSNVALNALNGSIRVGGSLIHGTAVHSGTGTTLCVDDYTGGYVARPTTC